MRRREFIGLLGGAVWPLAARAQQAGKMYRIGWLHPTAVQDSWLAAFRQGLREFDLVEGRDVSIEYRWGDGNFDRLPTMAADLVRLNIYLASPVTRMLWWACQAL
jgi:hypothetical protein